MIITRYSVHMLPAQFKLRKEQDSKHLQLDEIMRVALESPKDPLCESALAFEVVLRENYRICDSIDTKF